MYPATMQRPTAVLLTLLTLAAAAACKSDKQESVSAETWATVDGRTIMRDDVEKTFRRA